MRHPGGTRWVLGTDDPIMGERARRILQLDPSLPPEDVVEFVDRKWGDFLCPQCGQPLVHNGQNGAGTASFLCKRCGTRASIWNTFELRVWLTKQVLTGLHYHSEGLSIKASADLASMGACKLGEAAMCLPELKFSREGELEVIEYDGEKYGVVTSDMVYKGHEGLMLGVCGEMNATAMGNENTGEGLDEFFDEVERRVATEKYLFIMDARMNVAKRILERFKERAVIVLQNHTLWGDVLVYFYRDGWHTLRIRTDAFSEASKKRDESKLLGVGEIEVYSGLKGMNTRGQLKGTREEWLRETAEELLTQARNADWEASGRVDLVMKPKLAKLNSILVELQRRGLGTDGLIEEARKLLAALEERYTQTVARMVKRKIVHAWSALKLMRSDVQRLSQALLKEPLAEKERSSGPDGSPGMARKRSGPMLTERPKLLYRGPMNGPGVPVKACWALRLLRIVFEGKEITTNECEGRFGTIGMDLRRGRSMYLDRAQTRAHLQRLELPERMNWLISNYPMQEMGRRGTRRTRTRLIVGRQYSIKYTDWLGTSTERIIDVRGRKGDKVMAWCHLREDERTFKRGRIENIRPVLPAY